MYGLTLFVAIPVLIGAIVAFICQPVSAGRAAFQGAVAVGCLTCGLIVIGVEGLICIAMTLPLAVPLGALGGAIAYRLQHGFSDTTSVSMMLLLPIVTAGLDLTAKPQLFEVRTAIEIAAAPEKVWKHVIAFPNLPEPTEWYFRAGIAYPKRVRVDGSGVGAVRYCDFSTGPFVEPIQVWEEPKLLRFSVTESPAPMTELSPYANLVPKHLHGYFSSQQGQFHLTRMPNNRTLLEGTTWYRHGLWPEYYWRLWSDAIIHRIHMRVLNHIRTLSEQ
jgi:hypothetical protein